MIKISIIKNGQITNGVQFETQEQIDAWLTKHVAKNTFGLPERLVPQSECTEEQLASAIELIPEVLDEAGEILTPAMARLPAEYTIEITDISEQIELQKQSEEALRFLNQSDFKILRHLRQKALNLPLSLSEEEYLALEQQRHEASKKVIK